MYSWWIDTIIHLVDIIEPNGINNDDNDGFSTRSRTLSGIDQEKVNEEDKIPDGGLRSWLVVLGAFLMVVTSYGTSTAW